MQRVLLVVPSYNEEANIERVIEDLKKHPELEKILNKPVITP